MVDFDLTVASAVIVAAAGRMPAGMIEKSLAESASAVTASALTEMGTADKVDVIAAEQEQVTAVDLSHQGVN